MITQEEKVAYLDYFSENLEKLHNYTDGKTVVTGDDICSAFDLEVCEKRYPMREANRQANILEWPRTLFVDRGDCHECTFCQCVVLKKGLTPKYCPWWCVAHKRGKGSINNEFARN